MSGSVQSSSNVKRPCAYCFKQISKPNIQIHQKTCLLNPVQLPTSKCTNCGSSFKTKYCYKQHVRYCGKYGKFKCFYLDCNKKFARRVLLIHHIQNVHDESAIQPTQEFYFNSPTEFAEWKEKEEHDTLSYYSQQTGECRNLNKKTQLRYFYCQHDGRDTPHRKNGEAARISNRKLSKGRVKVGQFCLSYIRVVTLSSGKLSVTYYPTHNHPLNPNDIKHHPLSAATSRFIDKELISNKSPDDILESLKQKADQFKNSTGKIHRDAIVTNKLIRERAKKLNNVTKSFSFHDYINPNEALNNTFDDESESSSPNHRLRPPPSLDQFGSSNLENGEIPNDFFNSFGSFPSSTPSNIKREKKGCSSPFCVKSIRSNYLSKFKNKKTESSSPIDSVESISSSPCDSVPSDFPSKILYRDRKSRQDGIVTKLKKIRDLIDNTNCDNDTLDELHADLEKTIQKIEVSIKYKFEERTASKIQNSSKELIEVATNSFASLFENEKETSDNIIFICI